LWVVLTALNSSVLLGLVFFFQATRDRSTPPPTDRLILVLWLAVALYLLFGRARTRCRRLDLGLPIPARDLWLSHAVAVALAGGVVLGMSLGVLALHGVLIPDLLRGKPPGIRIGPWVAPLAAGLLLAVALVQSLEPSRWKLPGTLRHWARIVASLAVVPILVIALSTRPLLATGLCGVLALAAGIRGYRRVPPAFVVEPLQPDGKEVSTAEILPAGARSATASPETLAVPVSRSELVRILFRVIHHVPPWSQYTPLALYVFILLMGFLLGGGFSPWLEGEDVRYMYIPLGTYMLLAGIGLLAYQLYRLDPLPVTRRLLFGLLTIPSLTAYLSGFAAARLTLVVAPEEIRHVDYRVEQPYSWVQIDPGFMGISWSGVVPELAAPWGESHPAWHRPLFKSVPLMLVHPFAVAEESSADFEALMTSRAIEAVYGERIPYQTIRDRYFEVRNESVSGLKPGGFTLLDDYPDLEPPREGPEAPVLLFLVLAPWLLMTALFVRSFRATSSARRIRAVYWIALGVLLALMLGQVALALLGWYSPAASRGFIEILIRRLGDSTMGMVGSWGSSLALLGLGYRLARSQFVRAEIPQTPINCSFIDWERRD
jgi:hypothetical protein